MPSLYRQNTYNYKERVGNSHGQREFPTKKTDTTSVFPLFYKLLILFKFSKGFCMTVQILFSATTYLHLLHCFAGKCHFATTCQKTLPYCKKTTAYFFGGERSSSDFCSSCDGAFSDLPSFTFSVFSGGCRLFLSGLLGGKSHHIAHGKGKGNALTCRF